MFICLEVIVLTNKQMLLKTSNVLRYSTTLAKHTLQKLLEHNNRPSRTKACFGCLIRHLATKWIRPIIQLPIGTWVHVLLLCMTGVRWVRAYSHNHCNVPGKHHCTCDHRNSMCLSDSYW